MPRGRKKISPLLSLLHLLHRAGQRADGLFAQHLGSVDLTPRQLIVLQAVDENEGLSQMDIMAATGIDRSSVADLVRRLVKQGLLRRRRQKRDTRLYAVRLTPEGKKALTLGAPAAEATEEALLRPVLPEKRQDFLRILTTIAGHDL
jgi:DNA-binding MarR family transcriptional regulator